MCLNRTSEAIVALIGLLRNPVEGIEYLKDDSRDGYS